MQFVEKLDLLMNARGINKKKLSEQTGMPYSTIDSIFKRGYANIKLSNLRKLSDFFGVSIDYLVRDEIEDIEPYDPDTPNIRISSSEARLVQAFRRADPLDQELVLRVLSLQSDKNKLKNAVRVS